MTQYKPVDAGLIQAIALRILQASERYEAIAEKMQSHELDSVPMRGIETLVDVTIPRLEANLRACESAFDAASTKKRFPGMQRAAELKKQSDNSDLDAEIDHAAKQGEAQKKSKSTKSTGRKKKRG